MGRGLGALFNPASGSEGDDELRRLPVELISPNPRQPRRHFDEETLVSLAGSLSERGILQPVLVRPVPGGTYELIAGERRWRAAQLAGLDTIPALVRPQDDAASLELALIENMAREDLNPVEEAAPARCWSRSWGSHRRRSAGAWASRASRSRTCCACSIYQTRR